MTDERPTPAYGEYAPEGWEWKPEGEGSEERGGEGSLPSEGRPAVRPAGVPHNLGVRGSSPAPSQPEAAGRQPASDPHVYRAAPEPGPQRSDRAPGAGRPRTADRVVTIILLVLGGCGALYFAASLYQMPSSFELMAAALGVDDFVLPDSVRTLGTTGALLVLAVYALNLLYAVQRMRHGRSSFWVPLVAGVVAFIVVFACSAIAASQMPELMQELGDPTAVNRILEYVSQMSTAP